MTIADVKSGGWASHELLTSAQMNAIRAELLKCVDGSGGGSYTLTAPLIFSGFGVETDDLAVHNDLVVDNDLLVSNSLHVVNDLQVDDDVTVTGTLTANGNLIANNIFAFNSTGDFNDDVNVNDRWVFRSGGQTEFKAGNATQFFDLDDLAVMSDSHTYRLPLTPLALTLVTGTPTWLFALTNGSPSCSGWLQNDNTNVNELLFALPVNVGDVITNITATVVGGSLAGHGGLDPVNMPRLRLYEGPASGSVADYVAVGTQTDTATGAGYDAAHFITLSLSFTAAEAYYIVALRGEFGSNSLPGELMLSTIQANIVRKKLVSVNTFGA